MDSAESKGTAERCFRCTVTPIDVIPSTEVNISCRLNLDSTLRLLQYDLSRVASVDMTLYLVGYSR